MVPFRRLAVAGLLALALAFSGAGVVHAAGKAPASACQSPARAAAKFRRVTRFSGRLPALRRHVARALARPKLDEPTAVAAIVKIMDTEFVRVGSERYAQRAKGVTDKGKKVGPSYGASSLRKRHVRVVGNTVHMTFTGKSGVAWKRTITDKKLAATVKLFLAQPGDRLFEVPSARGTKAVGPASVRDLLRNYGAKPKDLRTLHANRLLEREISALPTPTSKRDAETNLTTAIKNVAARLGHLPSTCRTSYLDGRRLVSYAAGLE